MRKIEKMMVEAVEAGRNFSQGNTRVEVKNGITRVFLFDNMICEIKNGKKRFTDAGWPTVTTASRLRALGANCCRRGKKIIFA